MGSAGTRLAVEIGEFKLVVICEIKMADAKPCQRQQVAATDTPHTRNRNALVAQNLLLCFGHPAQVPGKGLVVIKRHSEPRIPLQRSAQPD